MSAKCTRVRTCRRTLDVVCGVGVILRACSEQVWVQGVEVALRALGSVNVVLMASWWCVVRYGEGRPSEHPQVEGWLEPGARAY